MIFNIPGGAADDSGMYKLISKTTLTVATKEVSIPLPSGYSRYRLTCYGYETSRDGYGLYVSAKSGGTRRNAYTWGGSRINDDGSGVGTERESYMVLPVGGVIDANLSEVGAIVDGSKTKIWSTTIVGTAGSSGDTSGHAVYYYVKGYVYNYAIDELSIGTLNSAYTISAGSTFILEGMKE